MLAALSSLCDGTVNGGGRDASIRNLAKELAGTTGAAGVSVFLTDGSGARVHIISGDDNADHGNLSIDASLNETITSLRNNRRTTHLESGSRQFTLIRDSLFSNAMVDRISIYPIKSGQESAGFIVAGFWNSDVKSGKSSPQDRIFLAAAKLMSAVSRPSDGNGHDESLKRKYLATLDQISTVVFVFHLPSGRLTEANESFFKTFGYGRSDIDRLTLFDLVFDSREAVSHNISCAMAAGRIDMPSKLYRHRDGSAIEMAVKGTTITSGGETYVLVTAVDLSEKRKAELEAEMHRVRYENFIRNSGEGIWRIEFTEPIDINQDKTRIAKEIAEKGLIAEGNKAFARMYGYDEPEELIGRRALEFIADLEVYDDSKLRFTEQNFSITNVQTIEKNRHGHIRYFENSYIGETKDNRLIRMWGIQRDVTEKVKLQDELLASETRYRNLVEQANDMVLLFNGEGEFVFANRRFFDQTGYESSEIMGKPVAVIVHPDDNEDIMLRIRDQFASPDKHIRHTFRLVTKYHEEKIVELSMTTLRSPERSTGILAIARDVTVEQSVKNALHESEEKYRSLVEHSLLGVLVVQDDIIVFANTTSSDLLETELSLLQGTPLSGFVHPNDYVQIFEKFEQAALAPNKDIQFSVRVITANGKMRSIEGWAAGITYLGKPAIQVAIVDVTDTKKLEEQLFQSQKMESIGQLASGVAHDFNNLLGSIYGAITILRNRYAVNDPNIGKYVDILDASAKRAAELTSQLLTFSRQRESDFKPVRLNDSVNDAMKIIIRSIGKNIKVEYSFEPALCMVEADPSQIEGIIINLSINSRDAMPDGGILRIETTNVEFNSSISKQFADAKPGRYACLSVTDNGIGMDEGTKRKIFEPFFTTKPIGKGTGLGLSIVYGIVKNHKGFISVYSEPGQGTTFKVYIPATDKAPSDAGNRVVTKEMPHGSETILLIDDELTLLDLTRELLQGLGYNVIAAEGALEGIRVFKEKHKEIDLVILDMLMPEMTGNEVYPVLKNIYPEVAVLLATGLSVGEKVDDMISRGVNGIVGKPYSVDDLAAHIRKILDSRK